MPTLRVDPQTYMKIYQLDSSKHSICHNHLLISQGPSHNHHFHTNVFCLRLLTVVLTGTMATITHHNMVTLLTTKDTHRHQVLLVI